MVESVCPKVSSVNRLSRFIWKKIKIMKEYSHLTNELIQLQKQVSEKQWLMKRLPVLQNELSQQKALEEEQSQQLIKEEADVSKLESLSLTGLFYTILGSKEQQLEKERQEALKAQLLFDETKRTFELLRQELSQVKHRLKQLGETDKELEIKLENKLALMFIANHAIAPELKLRYTELQAVQTRFQEVHEALEAAKEYQELLLRLIHHLTKAQNWGQWDLMGGGMIASMAKHGRLDDARAIVSSLQYHAQQLKKELSDLGQNYFIDLNVSSFDRFADIFFDNLFSDWMVQKQINQSLGSAQTIREQVHELIMKLSDDYAELKAEIERRKEEIQTKIINAR